MRSGTDYRLNMICAQSQQQTLHQALLRLPRKTHLFHFLVLKNYPEYSEAFNDFARHFPHRNRTSTGPQAKEKLCLALTTMAEVFLILNNYKKTNSRLTNDYGKFITPITYSVKYLVARNLNV